MTPVGLTPGVDGLLRDLSLDTVCRSAHCPNRGECFAGGTAAFLILGTKCTRNCLFCAIEQGRPSSIRDDEPQRVAKAAAGLGLGHVVITSVARDDLPDGGAAHFARSIQAVRDRLPEAIVEALIPDLAGKARALAAQPHVLNHNIETISRLYPAVRPQARYARSLGVLGRSSASGICTKSDFMLDLGERDDEVGVLLADLRAAGVGLLTIGQYLAPSPVHAPVARYVPPEEFDMWKRRSEVMGFAAVAAGPFVRSSYQAQRLYCRYRNSESL
jgi:lipoic acid synthetase